MRKTEDGGGATRGADEGSLVRCLYPTRSLAFWFRSSSILLLFIFFFPSLKDLLETPSGRRCLAGPLCERQPASSVSFTISSLGKGLCHSPRVF